MAKPLLGVLLIAQTPLSARKGPPGYLRKLAEDWAKSSTT